jgi:KUP system potassium uptake protein
LVIFFGSSAGLANAYGIAVAAVMTIASVLTVIWLLQNDAPRSRRLLVLMAAIFVTDLAFIAANSLKFTEGGWVPVLIGIVIFAIMNTWTRGRTVVAHQIAMARHSVHDMRQRLSAHPPVRVPGTAVFLASNPDGLPRALWHNLQYNNVLHEQVILLTIITEEVPRVQDYRRMEIIEVVPGITRVIARFGFMETPSVNDILYEASRLGVNYRLADAVFFVGTESVFFGRSRLRAWEKRLFAFLMRNSRRAASFYAVPETRLVEFGAQIGI